MKKNSKNEDKSIIGLSLSKKTGLSPDSSFDVEQGVIKKFENGFFWKINMCFPSFPQYKLVCVSRFGCCVSTISNDLALLLDDNDCDYSAIYVQRSPDSCYKLLKKF